MMDERMTESERTTLCRRIDELCAENERLRQENQSIGVAAYELGRKSMADENAKLQERIELLVTLLRNDCDIEASWDGLRHFWSIELTENGCLMRDRACKAEAENAKLRELVWTLANCAAGHGCDFCPINGGYGYVGEQDMCESVHARMRELGVEVNDG